MTGNMYNKTDKIAVYNFIKDIDILFWRKIRFTIKIK